MKAVTGLEGEIKQVLKSGKYILGYRKSIRAIKTGKARAVVIASKIPKWMEDDVVYYAKLGDIPVIKFKGTSYELGMVCGKPFPVAVMAILDPGTSRITDLVGE